MEREVDAALKKASGPLEHERWRWKKLRLAAKEPTVTAGLRHDRQAFEQETTRTPQGRALVLRSPLVGEIAFQAVVPESGCKF